MARVLGVIASSSAASSMFRVSGRMFDEHGTRAAQDEVQRLRGRDEREGRHQDLVAGLHGREQGGHLDRSGYRSASGARDGIRLRLQPCLALAVKARHPTGARCPGALHVLELAPGQRRPVERQVAVVTSSAGGQ